MPVHLCLSQTAAIRRERACITVQHAMQGRGCWLTGRLTEGRTESESTLLPSWRMCRQACSRKGVINNDRAVIPAAQHGHRFSAFR